MNGKTARLLRKMARLMTKEKFSSRIQCQSLKAGWLATPVNKRGRISSGLKKNVAGLAVKQETVSS